MANQMIALGVRAPQVNPLGPAIAQNAQMINMMRQQDAAERQAAAAAQQMQIAAAQEERAASLAKPQMAKAEQEAVSAQVKAVSDFLDLSAAGAQYARNAEDAIKIGNLLKQQFPVPALQQIVDQRMASLPEDPALFGKWKEETLLQSLDLKDQLSRELTQQNLGTSTRIFSTPKFGTGAGQVVEGSEAEVAFKPTVLNVEGIGGVVVDPNTGRGYPVATGGVGGYTRPGLVGGERGGASAALQTNPGAIKDSPFARSQPGYTGASGGFATFASPEAGIRAQENLLRSAYVGKGFNTIDKIVNRYAPEGPENSAASVSNYKKYIADRTGLDINAPISAGQIPAVAAAMREFETGNRPGGKPGAAPMTTEQAASAQEKQRKVKTFQDLTGVNLESGEDPITPLIKGSTSGRIEALGAEILGAIPEQFGGGATKGMENIGKLEALASTLTLAFAPGGRLSTGVSNEDRAKIEQQLGKIEDPNIPAGKRLAAWQEVKAIMARTIGITMKSAPAAAAGRPKPTPADVAGVRRNRDKREWTEGFRRQFGDEALRKALGGR